MSNKAKKSLLGYRVKVYSIHRIISQEGTRHSAIGVVVGQEDIFVDLVLEERDAVSVSSLLIKFPIKHVEEIAKLSIEEMLTHRHEYVRDLAEQELVK